MKSRRPDKLSRAEIEAAVQSAALTDSFLFTDHAKKRIVERQVTQMEIRQVFANGFAESKKDKFNEEFNDWDYSVRGKTIDGRSLRIIVAIDENVVLITVIDLDKGSLN